MTPPSLTVAREILASAAVNAGTAGNPTSESVAAAIDVVLAELDARPSVHGAASAITVSTPAAATAPTAILIGVRGGVEVRTREQAIALFGRGTALADAPLPFVMVGGTAIAEPAPGAPRVLCGQPVGGGSCGLMWGHGTGCSLNGPGRMPRAERAAALRADADRIERGGVPATTHGTAIPPDALVDDMLPCPFCRSTTLSVGKPSSGAFPILDRPYVACTACGARGPLARSDSDREAIANWNRRAASAADLRLLPVFESREGRDRGDVRDVVASCEASRVVTIKEFALIDEPPGVSVGYVVNAEQVKVLRDRVQEQRAAARVAEIRKLAADSGIEEAWADELIEAGFTVAEARGACRALVASRNAQQVTR